MDNRWMEFRKMKESDWYAFKFFKILFIREESKQKGVLQVESVRKET